MMENDGKMRKLSSIKKKEDVYSLQSADGLLGILDKKIHGIMKASINDLQMAIGDDHEKFPKLRKLILDRGNHFLRMMRKIVEENYNVELIPSHYEFKVMSSDDLTLYINQDTGEEA